MITNLHEPHEWFQKKTGFDISFEKYKEFLNVLFDIAVDKLLKREEVNLGQGLGKVLIKKTYRVKRKKNVNFGETRKNMNVMTEEQIANKEHIVYRTNDYYDKLHWLINPYDITLKCYKFNLVKQVKNRIPHAK